MIDCHVHTQRSKHGEGDLEDFVEVALDLNLEVLGFIEHAPLPFDKEHRLTEQETYAFLSDVTEIKKKYKDKLLILAGLEVDYLPSFSEGVKEIINKFSPDYFFGAIHFIEYNKDRISIWDYEDLQDSKIWNQYFKQLSLAVKSNFFDGIVHPDMILRSGIELNKTIPFFNLFMDRIKDHGGICYEINCSGFSKSSFNPIEKTMQNNQITYPSFELIKIGQNKGIKYTIGSDAHSPDKLYNNIEKTINELINLNINQVYYFKNRQQNIFTLSK